MLPNLCSTYFQPKIEELGSVPAEAFENKDRDQLCLADIQLTRITPTISQFKFLKICHLTKNHLKELPDEFFDLQCLEHLDASSNQFVVISDKINRLGRLVLLSFSRNLLQTLPDELFQLTSLQNLLLSGNRLSILSEKIGSLTSLSELSMRNNQLRCLPARIGKLVLLESLQVKNNFLSALPREIGNLRKLEYLNLTQNILKELPLELGRLRNVKQLLLRQNPDLRSLPYTLIQWRRSVIVKLDEISLRNQLNRQEPTCLQTLQELAAGRVLSMLSPQNQGKIFKDLLVYLYDSNNRFYCRDCDRHGKRVVEHFGIPAIMVRRWAKWFNNRRMILPFMFHYCQQCYQDATK